MLEGSVQRGGNRLRVNVQLIDAETGNHLWAERFDKPVADLFDMQDEIVSRLANTLNAQLIAAEARRAERSLHPDAMDLYFQGRACSIQGASPEYMAQARGFFERPWRSIPKISRRWSAWQYVDMSIGASLSDRRPGRALSAAESEREQGAVDSPRTTPCPHGLGRASKFLRTARLKALLNASGHWRWIEIWPTLTLPSVWPRCFMGRAAETEGHIHEAFRLSPRDICAYRWMHVVGLAKLQLGADAEAVGWLRRSIEANRNYSLAHIFARRCLALLGALDEARAAAKAGLALNPSFTIRRFRAVAKSSDNPIFLAGRERICRGMRLAGVPKDEVRDASQADIRGSGVISLPATTSKAGRSLKSSAAAGLPSGSACTHSPAPAGHRGRHQALRDHNCAGHCGRAAHTWHPAAVARLLSRLNSPTHTN